MSRPPEGATLDRQTLNRSLLARQHLLARAASTGDATAGAAAMVEHLVGLQAQVPRDPYIGLWSRLEAFDPMVLESMVRDRDVMRMTIWRTTLHLVTARDAPSLRAAMQPLFERRFAAWHYGRALAGLDVHEIAAFGAAALAERPMTMAELSRVVVARWPDRDAASLAFAARTLAPLVQVPPRGFWTRSGPAAFTTLDAWLDGRTQSAPTATQTLQGTSGREPGAEPHASLLDRIVRRYLRAFGPATVADIAAWSGLTGIRDVITRLRPILRSYRDEGGRELFDVEDGVFVDRTVPAPVRFVGEYDNLFLGHADRTRVTGDLRWGSDYVRKGAFFVDGFLAGAWFIGRSPADRREPPLVLEARRALSASEREAAVEEAGRLRAFLEPVAPTARVELASV